MKLAHAASCGKMNTYVLSLLSLVLDPQTQSVNAQLLLIGWGDAVKIVTIQRVNAGPTATVTVTDAAVGGGSGVTSSPAVGPAIQRSSTMSEKLGLSECYSVLVYSSYFNVSPFPGRKDKALTPDGEHMGTPGPATTSVQREAVQRGFQTPYFVCGIAPFGPDLAVLRCAAPCID